MAIRITDNVWCYNTTDCNKKVENLIRQQNYDIEVLIKLVFELMMSVVFLVTAAYLIICIVPNNIYKMLKYNIRIAVCMFLVYIVWIHFMY
jgi:hypothetical protein